MSQLVPYIQAVKAELNRRRALECQESLHEFVQEFWDVVEPGAPFVDNWHLHVICQHLEAVSDGTIKNLLINVPPGTSKSTLVSVMFPAWEWASRPHLRYLGASYSEPLAIRDAELCRAIITSERYRELFPEGAAVQRGNDNKMKYGTTAGGWRIATSVGGRGTGEHPHRKIVDDPHNVKQSESDVERAAAPKWFDGTLSSRGLVHDAATIVIMQRLHKADLSGHIEVSAGYANGEWDHLVIPMEYEEQRDYPKTRLGYKDPRKREGDLLWPKLFTPAKVASLKATLGEYRAAGQLQQRPSPDGGGILKRDKFHLWPAKKMLPDFLFVVQSYDTAFTEKTANDPTACSVYGIFEYAGKRQVMILDAWRDWLAYSDVKKRMMDDFKGAKYGGVKDDVLHPSRKADLMLIEEKGSGISLIQDMRRARLLVHNYNPGNASKTTRAHLASSVMDQDCVWVLESKKEPGLPITWVRDLIAECELFPNDEHDDYVDTLTQTLIYLSTTEHLEMPALPVEEPEEVDYEERRRSRRNPYG